MVSSETMVHSKGDNLIKVAHSLTVRCSAIATVTSCLMARSHRRRGRDKTVLSAVRTLHYVSAALA